MRNPEPESACGKGRERSGACSPDHRHSFGKTRTRSSTLIQNSLSLEVFPTLSARRRRFDEFVAVAPLRRAAAIFPILWEENTRRIYKTPVTCVKSVFLSRLSSALGGTKVKIIEQVLVNSRRQSHRKTPTLQQCCHLAMEEVVHIRPGSICLRLPLASLKDDPKMSNLL